MIVSMKKTTLICLVDDKVNALENLRELGVMHVTEAEKIDSEEYTTLGRDLDRADRAHGILASRKHNGASSSSIGYMSGADICDGVMDLTEENSALEKQMEGLLRDRDRLIPWGDFSPKLIADLKEKGVFVYLCIGLTEDLDNLPDDVTVETIRKEKEKIYFAVIAQRELENSSLPLAVLPEDMTLEESIREINDCSGKLAANNKKLDELSTAIEVLDHCRSELHEKREFAGNRDSMSEDRKVAYIQGYVPVPAVENLKAAAEKHGWALMITDPEEEDIQVPTLVKIPKIFEISKPIFEFIGIAPGYHEWDISTCFLIFFSIFFGMIVGDAGYGSIFLILSIVGKIIIKDKKMQLPLNLFALLSIMTIIWGALSGNYFAIPESMLPAWMHGISKPLTILPSWVKGVSQYQNLPVDEIRNKDVQYLCFLIAATHLSLARVWKAIILFPRVRDGLGQLGWGVIIWANFFLSVDLIVFNGSMPVATMYLYIIGAILVFACYVNWKDLGGVLNLPFSFIGSFVDVLSYIRLFAVGMSTFYIADSFNKMAVMVLDIPIPVVSVLGMIVILLFGHGLNILLSLIAVLVHGIRLNTLEFSNHMELQWMGFVYKPFKKIIPIKSNKEN